MSRSLLLSVRPRFAQALLAGTKTVEIRRRFPDVPVGMTVVIYSSSPDKAVLGTMRAEALIRSTATGIWRDYSGEIGIEKSELTEYLDGAAECSVLKLASPQPWPRPIPLGELRRLLQVEPAQSFRYLTQRQVSRREKLGAPASAEVIEFPSGLHGQNVPVLT